MGQGVLGTKKLDEFNIFEASRFPRQHYNLLGKMDEKIISLLEKHNIIIAGGAVTSVFSGATIKDFDLYPLNIVSYTEFKREFEQLIKESDDSKDKQLFSTANAITYRYHNKIYQLINKYVSADCLVYQPEWTVAEILGNFDFTVCMAGFDCKNSQWVLYDNFLSDIAERRLVFNTHSAYPICAMYRVLKYIKKGYELSGGELVKIALSINQIEMLTYKDLKEQLLGIDTLIFKDLTDALISKHGETAPVDFGMVMEEINNKLNSIWENAEVDVEEVAKSNNTEFPFD